MLTQKETQKKRASKNIVLGNKRMNLLQREFCADVWRSRSARDCMQLYRNEAARNQAARNEGTGDETAPASGAPGIKAASGGRCPCWCRRKLPPLPSKFPKVWDADGC